MFQARRESLASLKTLIVFLVVFLGLQTSLLAQEVQPETTKEYKVWLHENVFPESSGIDFLFNAIMIMTCGVGIAVGIVFVVFLVQYRYQPGRRAIFSHGNPKLEIVWTLIPTLMMALTAAFSQATWANLKNWPTIEEGEQQPLMVNVIAQQFYWRFQYPGKDGVLGEIGTEFRDPTGGLKSQIGINPNDPAGKDDYISNELVIPVKRKVFAGVTSLDVLHSFFLPHFRVKQDTVPGLKIPVWFRSVKTTQQVIGVNAGDADHFGVMNPATGEKQIITNSKPMDVICAELCGAGHYTMSGDLYVVTESEYKKFEEAINEIGPNQ